MTPKPQNTILNTVQFILTLLLALPASQDGPPVSFALLAAPQGVNPSQGTGPSLPPKGLPMWGPDTDPLALPNRPTMPIEDWRRWIEEHAANTQRGLRLRSAGGGVLVQGTSEAVASLEDFAKEVQQLIEDLRIEIKVTVQAAESDPVVQTGWLPSGGHLALGQMQRMGFVGSWRSEIAADSAVAEPEVWTSQTGWSLHLHASRQVTGAGILMAGSFQLNAQTGATSFDPETPDLGLMKQPQIAHTRLDFAGLLAPGKTLQLQTTRDGQLLNVTIEAQVNGELSKPGGWAVLETANLWPDLPWIETTDQGSPWPPSSLAAILAGSGGGGSALWAGSLLLIPPGAEALESQARQLIQALSTLGQNHILSAQLVPDSCRIPGVEGLPMGLRMGQVTSAMTGYRTEMATDAWIAEPQVQILFHGTSLEGNPATPAGRFSWEQKGLIKRDRIAPSDLAYLGSLESLTEQRRSGTLLLEPDNPKVKVTASDSHQEIALQLLGNDQR